MIRNGMRYLAANMLVIGLASFLSTGCSGTAPDPNKPHHTNRGFRNLHNYHKAESPGFLDLLKWRWERRSKEIPPADSYNFPVANNDPGFLRSNKTEKTFTWIGHATALLQVEGKNILTDPQFSERASPVQWAGPRRVVPPGLPLDQLPHIDAVVISHDHYDSLDTPSIERLLRRKRGNETTFFVPLGLKSWFEDLGARRVVEMDWWDCREFDSLEIIAVPVHHWSKRGLIGRNQTLWAGWVVRSKDFSFFFAGDSGYTPHFKEIGDRLGPFDLAAIPIGAYEPRWFMKHHHICPEEAVMAHLDATPPVSPSPFTGERFILTDEPLDEHAKAAQGGQRGVEGPRR